MAMEIGGRHVGAVDMLHTELVDRRTSNPMLIFTLIVRHRRQRERPSASMMKVRHIRGKLFELIAFEVWRNQNQTAFFHRRTKHPPATRALWSCFDF